MNLQSNKHRLMSTGCATLLLSMGLAGCAGVGNPEAPELTVRALATKRWQALLAQDFDKAYTFVVPSYRALNTAETYKKNRQVGTVKWIAAKVVRVECAEQKCEARIDLESKPMVPFGFKGTISTGLDETWVFEQGQWWLLEKP